MTPQPVDTAPDRRGYVIALLVLAAGAALLLLGYSRTWAQAVVSQPGLPTLVVDLDGRDLQPGGAAAAVLALAGVAGLVATRRIGRVVSGVLLLLTGLAAAGSALAFGVSGGLDAVRRLASDRAGVDVTPTVSTSSWWLVAVVGGLLVAVAGVLAVVRGARWPVLGRRYERAGGPAPARAGRPPSAWEQLDQGVDPTLGHDVADSVADGDATRDADRVRTTDPAPDTMTPTAAEEDR